MHPRDVDNYKIARARMVARLIDNEKIYSGALLEAMSKVPRHLFVSEALRYNSYEDTSLPIGYNQTISKPSTVAKMVQALNLDGSERVLEIGCGSGYQAAVIAEIASQVVTIERIEDLFRRARETLLFSINYKNISVMHKDDFSDISGNFDAIIVAAGASMLPENLFTKLCDNGRLVIPIGSGRDYIIKRYIKKANDKIIEDDLGNTAFVPLVL